MGSRCAQMFSDVHRCFQMITDVFGFSLDILKMSSWCFLGCSLDIPSMIAGFLQDDHFKWNIQRNSMIPKYSIIPAIRWSQLFNDPQPFDDPQLFDDQLEVWTLIEKCTVIPPSLMVLFLSVDKTKAYVCPKQHFFSYLLIKVFQIVPSSAFVASSHVSHRQAKRHRPATEHDGWRRAAAVPLYRH